MSDTFIENIREELTKFQMSEIETIMTGTDRSGSHIYTVHNLTSSGNCIASCEDTVGFAAIGIGSHHAESQFMLAGHHRASPVPETLFLTYLAKKRAEVAPGVGGETDMLMVGPQLGSLQNIRTDVIDGLDRIYRRHGKGATHADRRKAASNKIRDGSGGSRGSRRATTGISTRNAHFVGLGVKDES
jgi:hypothetical protein